MGGCCGSGTKILIRFEDKEQLFEHVADIEVLRLNIVERLQIQTFDLFIDGKLISTNEEFRQYLHSRTLIEISIKKKLVEVIKPPVKEKAEASKIQVQIPKKYSECLYEIVDRAEKPMVSCILLSNSYFLVHRQYVTKNSSHLSLKYKDTKEKLIPLLEHQEYCLYKIENESYNSFPNESCINFTNRAKILGQKNIELTQSKDNPEFYVPSEYLNNNYLGFPVFSGKSLIGFISSVTENSATLCSASFIVNELIPSTIKPKKKVEVREKFQLAPKVSIGNIKFANSPERPVPLEETEFLHPSRKLYQESEAGDEEIVIEMNIDLGQRNTLNLGQRTANEYTFVFIKPDTLIAYHPSSFAGIVIKCDVPSGEGLSFTPTESGMIMVVGITALKMSFNGQEKLNNLQYEHNYHSAIFHKSRLYILGGRNTLKVEILDADGN